LFGSPLNPPKGEVVSNFLKNLLLIF